MSSYSVKMRTRVSFHLAGGPWVFVVPRGGRSGHMFCRIQSTNLRTRASGRPLAASAISVISSRSCFSRAKASGLARRRVERGRLDLGLLLGLEFLLGERGPVVVVVDALGEE